MADTQGMDPSFASKLDQLISASGGRVYIESGYRSYDEQQALYDQAVAQYGPNQEMAAPPGSSNHEKGIAADLGGDLAWAQQHAAEFGLWFPLDWEDWHIEPVGSRDGPVTRSTNPYQIVVSPGIHYKNLTGDLPAISDPMSVFRAMLNSDNPAVPPSDLNIPASRQAGFINAVSGSSNPIHTTNMADVPAVLQSIQGNLTGNLSGIVGTDLDRFMAAVRAHESAGDYQAIGPSTPWGHATGAYQFLDGTWGGYGGYARAMDAPPEVQDEYARRLMSDYYAQFGNWGDVAAAWYAGPNGNFNTQEVQTYVQAVLGAM